MPRAAVYIALALLVAILLVGDFGLIIGMRYGGFRWTLCALVAGAAVAVPVLAGYATPRSIWASVGAFVAVGIGAVVVAVAAKPIQFWPDSVWMCRFMMIRTKPRG